MLSALLLVPLLLSPGGPMQVGPPGIGATTVGVATRPGPGAGVAGAAQGRVGAWLPPVLPLRVLGPFSPPEHPWLPGHRGVDLGASAGSVVRAAGEGRVTFAGQVAGRGVVVVDHGALRTTYEPVAASVTPGQRVGAGHVLGVIAPGVGHCGSGRCLHLGLRRGREYLDPQLILEATRARLRPW